MFKDGTHSDLPFICGRKGIEGHCYASYILVFQRQLIDLTKRCFDWSGEKKIPFFWWKHFFLGDFLNGGIYASNLQVDSSTT